MRRGFTLVEMLVAMVVVGIVSWDEIAGNRPAWTVLWTQSSAGCV